MNSIASLPISLPNMNDSFSSTPVDPSNEKALREIGKDFESLFYSMLLKELRSSLESEEGGGLFAGEKTGTLGTLFDMYMGQHLSSSSSLGISQAVISYLSNQPRESSQTPPDIDISG